MVGSPYQTEEQLTEDLLFLARLKPHMIGIGPFITQQDTPFRGEASGTLEQTLVMISLLRLLFPKALIPATTALGTISYDGREQGILSGANVVMPNLSPVSVRKKYLLYDNKICTGDEAAECRMCLNGRIERLGYRLVESRGDYPGM
jgi:biotin synthase